MTTELYKKQLKLFNRIVNIVIQCLIPLAFIALALGLVNVVWNLKGVIMDRSISEGFDVLITDILSMFVVIELLRSIIEYFEHNRLKITLITEAAFVFILREIMIGIYNHSFTASDIAALSLLLMVVGTIRTLAIYYSPNRNRIRKKAKTRAA